MISVSAFINNLAPGLLLSWRLSRKRRKRKSPGQTVEVIMLRETPPKTSNRIFILKCSPVDDFSDNK